MIELFMKVEFLIFLVIFLENVKLYNVETKCYLSFNTKEEYTFEKTFSNEDEDGHLRPKVY